MTHDLTQPAPADPHADTDAGLTGIDPAFVFAFRSYDEIDESRQRWSTWLAVEPLCRGPEPRPEWVVTSQAALDTELGVLKTGKEADVFLVERGVPDDGPSVVMAAKRYRSEEHRTFHRSAVYSEGRRVRNTRDTRAMQKKTTHGRAVAAGQWAWAEWQALVRLWSLGVPVPYPVQVDGTELLMEWVTVDGETAPRLSQTRPSRTTLDSYYAQLREVISTMAQQGLVHGDLSAYNILAAGERLVVIDLPQVVDLVANPTGMELLMRDCANVCAWFRGRGLAVDEHELFGHVVAHAF
jgi:RIO kinase 1